MQYSQFIFDQHSLVLHFYASFLQMCFFYFNSTEFLSTASKKTSLTLLIYVRVNATYSSKLKVNPFLPQESGYEYLILLDNVCLCGELRAYEGLKGNMLWGMFA